MVNCKAVATKEYSEGLNNDKHLGNKVKLCDHISDGQAIMASQVSPAAKLKPTEEDVEKVLNDKGETKIRCKVKGCGAIFEGFEGMDSALDHVEKKHQQALKNRQTRKKRKAEEEDAKKDALLDPGSYRPDTQARINPMEALDRLIDPIQPLEPRPQKKIVRGYSYPPFKICKLLIVRFLG